jgi:prepilin-type processing-associated H-X9-DG protein
MNFSLPLFERSLLRHISLPTRGAVRDTDFVVARMANAAPSNWLFFDGHETVGTSDTSPVIVPGAAFFVDEAWPFRDISAAEAQANRLNAFAPGCEALWRAVSVRLLSEH